MSEPVTEAKLRAWLADGSDAAWVQVSRAVVPWLGRLVLPLVRSPDDADDVVQRVLVTLWRAHGSIRESVVGWLRVTARNEALDLLKSPRRRHVSVHGDEWDAILATHEETRTVATLTHAHLLSHLHAVSPDLRETFLLRAVDGFTYPQIARLQDISVGAAKMRVLRARAAIRALHPDAGY